MSEFIDEFKKKLIRSGLASWLTISGCSNFEIDKLEKHFSLELPELYKDFLGKMGRKAGRFYQGTDMFYHYLFDNREAFEDVLEGDGFPFDLDPTIFVFSSHQGYIFHFFDVRESADDPPVYGYKEGHLKMELINESFSAFLLESLEEVQRNWLKL